MDLHERLGRLRLPWPLEPMIRRAVAPRRDSTRHEDIVAAWEMATRVMVGSLWAIHRESGHASRRITSEARKLTRPSFGHWAALLRLLRESLLEGREAAILGLAPLLEGLQRPVEGSAALEGLAALIRDTVGPSSVPSGTCIHDLFQVLPAYRNRTQSTHYEADPELRERATPILLEALLEALSQAPPSGRFRLAVIQKVFRDHQARSSHRVEMALMVAGFAALDAREIPGEVAARLLPGRPYLLLDDPLLFVPVFPMAAAEPADDGWSVGWLAGCVHGPTFAYQEAATRFQVRLLADESLAFFADGAAAEPELPEAVLALEPWRGLAAYSEMHSPVYFGREEETELAVSRLLDERLLIICGASGSGKSSVARAGLVPALRSRLGESVDDTARSPLRIADMRPGARPHQALRRTLRELGPRDAAGAAAWAREIEAALPPDARGGSPRGLVHLLGGLTRDGSSVFLLVDQAEEIVTLCTDRAERRAFLDLLVELEGMLREIRAFLVLTLRADQQAQLLDHESFARLVDRSHFSLGAIPWERLERVIREPLRGRNTSLEAGLVETILHDVSRSPGAVPLLSQVLKTLWDERGRYGDALTRKGYEEAGRLESCLRKQAEAARTDAVASGHAEGDVERLFLELGTLDEEGAILRRRVERTDLAFVLGLEEERLRSLLEPFVERRLLIVSGAEEGGETVEVVHEALFDAWPFLVTLLAREKGALQLRREVELATRAWETSGRRRELWSDATSRLRQAEELIGAGRLALDRRCRDFLEASRASVRRRERLKRGALAVMTVLALSTATGFFVAMRNAELAEGKTLEAKQHAKVAEARTKEVLRLADVKRLEQLLEEEKSLWPAHPEKVDGIEDWLRRARDLQGNLPTHRMSLLALRRMGRPSGGGEVNEVADDVVEAAVLPKDPVDDPDDDPLTPYTFLDTETQWQHDVLAGLTRDIEALEQGGSDGPIASMEKRLERARTIEEDSITRHRDRWDAAVRSIADPEQCPNYGGLTIVPQMGLVPLDRDPKSGFWEFLHLETHEGPLPERGPDGRWQLTVETGLIFVLLPGGGFHMGAQKEDPEGLNYDPMAEDEEGRVREVELDPFFLSKYEMTQEQWKRASGTNPSRYQTTEFFADEIGLHPLDKISWHEATATLSRLGLVLPTEAQWEYAARAGTDWPWSSGPEVDSLVASANVADAAFIKSGYWNGKPGESWNDGVAIHARVGSFRPNGFGLHDVHGNVFEWCRDIYSPYSSEPMPGDGERHAPWPTDKGTMWNHNRVMRGGSYYYPASYARSARRIEVPPENAQGMFGVRPARKLDD